MGRGTSWSEEELKQLCRSYLRVLEESSAQDTKQKPIDFWENVLSDMCTSLDSESNKFTRGTEAVRIKWGEVYRDVKKFEKCFKKAQEQKQNATYNETLKLAKDLFRVDVEGSKSSSTKKKNVFFQFYECWLLLKDTTVFENYPSTITGPLSGGGGSLKRKRQMKDEDEAEENEETETHRTKVSLRQRSPCQPAHQYSNNASPAVETVSTTTTTAKSNQAHADFAHTASTFLNASLQQEFLALERQRLQLLEEQVDLKRQELAQQKELHYSSLIFQAFQRQEPERETSEAKEYFSILESFYSSQTLQETLSKVFPSVHPQLSPTNNSSSHNKKKK